MTAALLTHRERVLRTFRFEGTDRLACDLMEGTVWPALLDYFRSTHGLGQPPQVLDFLDADFRWIWTEYLPLPPEAGSGARGEHTSDVSQGPLMNARSVAEVESYAWPEPIPWQAPDFAAARRRWPDHALAFSPGWYPLFWGACEAFGVETALLNLAVAPELVECAVQCRHERFMERLMLGVQAAQGFCDVCWLADDFAGQESLLLSPGQWRRIVKPALAEQVRLVKAHNLRVLYHSCGAVRPVLADLIEIGIDGLVVFQTNATGMDAMSIAAEFGGRMVFYGGIDVQHLLSFATPAEVRATVQSNARAFAACGGYIVANSHHSVPTIRGQNVEAMFAAGQQVPGSRARG